MAWWVGGMGGMALGAGGAGPAVPHAMLDPKRVRCNSFKGINGRGGNFKVNGPGSGAPAVTKCAAADVVERRRDLRIVTGEA